MLGGQYLFLACFNNFLNLTTHMYVGSTWSALNDSVKRTKCGMPWICQMYFRPPDRVLLNNAVSSFSKLFLVLNPPSLILHQNFHVRILFLFNLCNAGARCGFLAGRLNNVSGAPAFCLTFLSRSINPKRGKWLHFAPLQKFVEEVPNLWAKLLQQECVDHENQKGFNDKRAYDIYGQKFR